MCTPLSTSCILSTLASASSADIASVGVLSKNSSSHDNSTGKIKVTSSISLILFIISIIFYSEIFNPKDIILGAKKLSPGEVPAKLN